MIRNRKDLAKVKRIVVKVGTSTITYPNCSRNFARMDYLCRELDGLISGLTAYRDALAAGDAETLRDLLREGRERKEEIDTEWKN